MCDEVRAAGWVHLALEARSVCVLVLLVGHGEEHGGGEVTAFLGETEAEDAVYAVEVCGLQARG